MRILCMHKATAEMEAGLPPKPELLSAMGPLMESMHSAGIFVAGEGLRPSAAGVRLRYRGNRRTVETGPLTGGNELLSGFAIVRARSLDEAVRWADRYAKVVGDVELDVRPVCEPWDLGFMPKPANTKLRYMIAHKADARFEAGRPMSPTAEANLDSLTREMSEAGVLSATVLLAPSRSGRRLRYRRDRRTVVDGPFTESKELIAGFSLVNVDSVDEAIEWSDRFAAIIGDVEIDVRPVTGSYLAPAATIPHATVLVEGRAAL